MTKLKLNWKRSGNHYVAKFGDFVFRLIYQNIGVYGYGKCYGLQARKIDETEFKYLNYTFVVRSDGYKVEEKYSIDRILWDENNIELILFYTESYLQDNVYID